MRSTRKDSQAQANTSKSSQRQRVCLRERERVRVAAMRARERSCSVAKSTSMAVSCCCGCHVDGMHACVCALAHTHQLRACGCQQACLLQQQQLIRAAVVAVDRRTGSRRRCRHRSQHTQLVRLSVSVGFQLRRRTHVSRQRTLRSALLSADLLPQGSGVLFRSSGKINKNKQAN